MSASQEVSNAEARFWEQLDALPAVATAVRLGPPDPYRGVAMLAAEAMAEHPDESFSFKDSLLPSSIDFALNGVGCGIDPCDDGRWSASFKRPGGRRHFGEFHTFAASFEWLILMVGYALRWRTGDGPLPSLDELPPAVQRWFGWPQ